MSDRLVVVSPHLDDAVLSCGRLIAALPGAIVVTVLTGSAPPGPIAGWDRAGGFTDGDDVMAVRRREDLRALRLLRARAIWLDLPQDIYRAGPLAPAQVRSAVEQVIARARGDVLALPLGLHHGDHLAVADALRGQLGGAAVRYYADQPYAAAQSDALARRLEQLGPLTELPAPQGHRWRKTAAVALYRSQVRALGGGRRRLGAAPERYWAADGAA